MKDYKDDWEKYSKEESWEKMSEKTKENEVLRITFYKTPSGIKAESRGMVKGTTDLAAVSTVLSDVLNTSIKMLGRHSGIGNCTSENNSGEFRPDEWFDK